MRDVDQRAASVANCRFGCPGAVGTFALAAGCRVYPDDREQALCLHHAMRAQGAGDIRCIALAPGLPEWDRQILAGRYGLPEAAR